jgi:hypothetical protein
MQGGLLALMEPAVIAPPATIVLPLGRYPRRVMRSRRRGARLPASVKWCGRGSALANPFPSERFGHARSVLMHWRWFEGSLGAMALERVGYCPGEIDALLRLRERALRRLPAVQGYDLGCWCPLTSRWCHVDIVIEGANPDLPKGFRFQ